jgi:dTDP-glucose 4,6-dehydratase
MKILVTGGSGFIGSNFLYFVLKKTKDDLVNITKHTYAMNPRATKDLEGTPRYRFVAGDITDATLLYKLLEKEKFDAIVNFAAETHVSRSFLYPKDFLQSNTLGVFTFLEILRHLDKPPRFLQISTDEVLGNVSVGRSKETDPINPMNVYSASKAGAELWIRTYHRCWNLPVLIMRSTNNYGPRQHPEKLIAKLITRALADKEIKLFKDSENRKRDWIYVEDTAKAIYTVLTKGKFGETYHIGTYEEKSVEEIADTILKLMNKKHLFKGFIAEARLQDDERYQLDWTKIRKELGWKPEHTFEEGIAKTIDWFRQNEWYWKYVESP